MYLDKMIKLVSTRPFDIEEAERILPELSNIDQTIVVGESAIKTTLLGEAVGSNNLEAVRFLLDHGADPNYIGEGYECPLADLQFPYDDKSPEENYTRYEIARQFFIHGADPNLLVEGETIFDDVTYTVYNHGELSDWPYLVEFYKMLVVYGGGGYVYKSGAQGYGKPVFSESIDFDRVNEYQVRFQRHEDGYHIEGYLLNPEGKIIGQL